MRTIIRRLLWSAAALALAGPAAANSFVDDFTLNNDGWTQGDIGSAAALGSTGAVGYNPSGWLETTDVQPEVAFISGSNALNALHGALGGILSYDLSDDLTDGVNYAGPVLYSSLGTIAFATTPPVASPNFSHYDISLTNTGWFFYGGGGALTANPVNASDFAAILAGATTFAVHADWHTGADFTRLDNVEITTAAPVGGIPEPESWALLLIGFAAMGAVARRRKLVAS